jgi:hypothetical protein
MVERILYIWAIRHPASGYVQGINDLVTPFLIVFLQDHVEQDVTRAHCQVEGSFLTLPGRGPFLIVFLQDHVEQDVTRAHCQVEGPQLTLPGRGSFPHTAR